MFRQWLTLVIIVLVYIPVAIDATVLHVAAPTLSMTLGASGNELLWIIDIYSLVMAGMVLPMGALGDRIGFKRLLMLGGTLFGLASLAAAFSHTASWLIATRVLLAIGAAMIVPATLAGIRATFCEEKHRNMALGVWAAVGSLSLYAVRLRAWGIKPAWITLKVWVLPPSSFYPFTGSRTISICSIKD